MTLPYGPTFVITRTNLAVCLQDALAAIVSGARRTLRDMATATERQDAQVSELRGEIVNWGSSYAAFKLALHIRPTDLGELLRVAGVYDLTGRWKGRAFDACVDGYAVFHDGRLRRKL